MARLFGTDGVRGVANSELTCEMALQIGRAAAFILTEKTHHKAKIIIGKDTRISSDMLESALIAGICSVGADAVILGVVPTPAVAYLVKKYNADAGVMISASHNPVEYNGIKIFDGEGYKLSDQTEEEIEAIILDNSRPIPVLEGTALGSVTRCKTAIQDYIKHISSTVKEGFDGLRVAIDCANGSASSTAKQLFESLGADCLLINCEPDGTNINDKCGSTHIDAIAEFTRKNKCQVGLSFDGDADRCLAVDENGNLVDGDKLIAIFAKQLLREGKLNKNTLVATVMSNMGLFSFAEENGINAVATKVGDRYVLEEMIKNDFVIGGEQSGHIIFKEHATTGDGQLSGVQLLSILKQECLPMSKLASIMERFPQVLINVKVTDKEGLNNDPFIRETIDNAEKILGKTGRVLVRVSGTEPIIRVMVEGRDFDLINSEAVKIADTIRQRLA